MWPLKPSLKKYTDEELMQKAAAGQNAAFEELYERYSSRMLGYFHRMLWKDKELAEDCLHKLFLNIIEKPRQFDTSRSFKTWLYSAAHNICKNEYRRMENRPPATQPQEPVMGEESFAPLQEHQYDNKLFLQALENELGQLGDAHSQTFRLRYFEQLSMKEIADIMECPEGTVKSRLFYTIKVLSQKLKPFKTLISK